VRTDASVTPLIVGQMSSLSPEQPATDRATMIAANAALPKSVCMEDEPAVNPKAVRRPFLDFCDRRSRFLRCEAMRGL
jgi:hypothetical protein